MLVSGQAANIGLQIHWFSVQDVEIFMRSGRPKRPDRLASGRLKRPDRG